MQNENDKRYRECLSYKSKVNAKRRLKKLEEVWEKYVLACCRRRINIIFVGEGGRKKQVIQTVI
jgi:hypothetical protein